MQLIRETSMPQIKCHEHIEQFPPADVFEAGTLTRNLPDGVSNFRLTVPGERIESGGRLSMDVGLLGAWHVLEAEVTDYQEDERVVITGSHKLLGSAFLELLLAEHKSGGTQVSYALNVDLGPIVPRFGGPLVTRQLKGIVSQYAGAYTENVVTDLSSRRAPRRRQAA